MNSVISVLLFNFGLNYSCKSGAHFIYKHTKCFELFPVVFISVVFIVFNIAVSAHSPICNYVKIMNRIFLSLGIIWILVRTKCIIEIEKNTKWFIYTVRIEKEILKKWEKYILFLIFSPALLPLAASSGIRSLFLFIEKRHRRPASEKHQYLFNFKRTMDLSSFIYRRDQVHLGKYLGRDSE